jgi:hypothetical protein
MLHANLFVPLCNYRIASIKVCCDFWCVDLILLFVVLIELLGLQMSSFVVYEVWCLCLPCGP